MVCAVRECCCDELGGRIIASVVSVDVGVRRAVVRAVPFGFGLTISGCWSLDVGCWGQGAC